MKYSLKDIIIHLLFWIVITIVFTFSEWGYNTTFSEAFILEMTFLPVRIIAVYVNWFYFIPRFLYKNELLKFAGVLVLLLLSLAIVQRFVTLYWVYPVFFPEYLANSKPNPWYIFRIMQNLVIITSPVAFTTGWKLFLDWFQKNKETQQLKAEKIEAELKYLKSQVNPHFLFNTLNNIYGLAREKSDKVPGLILKLSEILSFTLYESGVKKISLAKELALIQNLLSLEKDRYDDRVIVHVDFPTPVPDIEIAPLLLVPLVENAFKHGVRNEINQANVEVSAIFENGTFHFEVSNSIAQNGIETNDNSGIGLKNLKKRLELLYPDNHTLRLKVEHNTYFATLEILML